MTLLPDQVVTLLRIMSLPWKEGREGGRGRNGRGAGEGTEVRGKRGRGTDNLFLMAGKQ